MRQIAYALRSTGRARRGGTDGNVLVISTTAPGRTVHAWEEDHGPEGSSHLHLTGAVTCESELVVTGDVSFQQAGSVRFGAGQDRLRFSTDGNGHFASGPAIDGQRGTAIWWVDGGEGWFAGASGTICSIFVISDDGEVTDHHLGVVHIE